MDKEREIEKMANDIADICVDLADTSCGDKQCCTCMPKYLIEAGYRKLNDDDIVVTKAMQQGSCGGMDDRTLEFFKKHNAEVRKETAKEILQTIWDRFSRKISDEFGDMASDIKYITLDVEEVYDYLLGDLAEEYGIEVDE